MRTFVLSIAFVIAAVSSGGAFAQPAVSTEVAPGGKLRVASFANGILYAKSADDQIDGIARVLGDFIAAKLGMAAEPIVYPNPEAYANSFGTGAWDIAIGPRTPATQDKLDFAPDFVLVDNLYLAAPGHEFANPASVDRPGVKVGVALNGAPDQLLTRVLKSAELIRAPGDVSVAIELLRSGKADVYASNGEVIYAIAAGLPGSRVIGPFTTVRMAAGLPKSKSAAAQAWLTDIVKQASSAGLARISIERLGLKGVRPAE